MRPLLFIVSVLLFFSCGNSEKKGDAPFSPEGKELEIKYATGFNITDFEDFSLIKINQPWPDAGRSFTYLLAEKNAEIPEDLEYDQKITIPVEELVVTSTTHIPALEALEVETRLTGFPGLDFISSEKTRKLIDAGHVKELGKNENLNTEVLIDLEPDVVIGFAIDGHNRNFENIRKTGIPVVFNGDWMEENPVGKAEWIKFMGAFVGKTKEATEAFHKIEQDYKQAKELAKSAEEQPTVIGGSMYQDQWFMPYGNSWQAIFFKDANANYLYKETRGNGSMSLSFENVLEKAGEAQFWVSSGQFTSYSQLLNESRHYNQFKAVKEKQVYSVSLSKGETGGALYYELGPQRPDLVLKDLISIFHPGLLPEHQPIFFMPLED